MAEKSQRPTRPLLGWHEAGPGPDAEPVLLATLRAPRPGGTVVAVYSDGSLAYRFGRDPRWVRSRLSAYGRGNSRLGAGENLTPAQFIERHIGLGYAEVGDGR